MYLLVNAREFCLCERAESGCLDSSPHMTAHLTRLHLTRINRKCQLVLRQPVVDAARRWQATFLHCSSHLLIESRLQICVLFDKTWGQRGFGEDFSLTAPLSLQSHLLLGETRAQRANGGHRFMRRRPRREEEKTWYSSLKHDTVPLNNPGRFLECFPTLHSTLCRNS